MSIIPILDHKALRDVIEAEDNLDKLQYYADHLKEQAVILLNYAEMARNAAKYIVDRKAYKKEKRRFMRATAAMCMPGMAIATTREAWAHKVAAKTPEKWTVFKVDVSICQVECTSNFDPKTGDQELGAVGDTGDLYVKKIPAEAHEYKEAIIAACNKLFVDTKCVDLYKLRTEEDIEFDDKREHRRCWLDFRVTMTVLVVVA